MQRDSGKAIHQDTPARHAAGRRRGGIEPLRVSTPHELKSCPSTNPTHPGHAGRQVSQGGSGHPVTVVMPGRPWTHARAKAGNVAAVVQQGPGQAILMEASAWRAAGRRRGGIEPLRVSTPHELKSCPSASPTHPGPPAKNRPASVKAKARPLVGSLPCTRGKAHMTGGLRGFAGPDPRGMRLRQSA